MEIGSLVYVKPKTQPNSEEEYIGIIIHKQQVGSHACDSTILYDVLLELTEEVTTVSDIYFEIRNVP